MSEASQQIHDMIQTFALEESPERMASRLLDILQAMNERMDAIETSATVAINILSKSIKPK